MDYNPSRPVILGQEWVPVRDVDLVFDEATNSVEVGHTFTLESSTQINNGRFYINDFAYNVFADQGYTISIYETGDEASVGPIQKVTIPCNGGATTGGITFESPATNVATALANPGTIRAGGLEFDASGGYTAFTPFFNVSDYQEPLEGKRILGVTFVTTYHIGRIPVGGSGSEPDPTLEIEFGVTTDFFGNVVFPFNFIPIPVWPADGRFTVRHRFGNVSYFGGGATANTFPLTYDELLRFDSAAFGAGRCFPVFTANHLGENPYEVNFTYMAMEVFYCEETRLAYGTKVYNANVVPLGTETRYTWGVNPITLVEVETADPNPVLPAGDYTITVTQANFGDNIEVTRGFGPHPELNSLRELYTLPTFEGVQLNIPNPMDDSVLGETLTTEQVVEIPQLSLHTSGGTALTELHAYGRQGVAQAWGTNTVIQEVDDTVLGADADYAWIRFYARRWGDTTVALTVQCQEQPSATASIAPEDFDLLEEIVDGWREVDLLFDTPATLGSIANPHFEWSASGETAGSRWEILSATAPALSGITGDLFNLATNQTLLGTYNAPHGDIEELEWMPQGVGGPFVDTPSADDTTDAVILLSQAPPAVSGISTITLCQPLTGIGENCDIDPCCIPSSVAFNQILWTSLGPESIPTSGFGFYELQRSDTVDTEWQTIMQCSDIEEDSFNDFEARVGIETSYRIRSVNLYGFVSDWSIEVTATITEPGVTIGCRDNGHLLIFTSNENQCGNYTLAYSTVWEGNERVSEDFVFPEAGFTSLQAMYDRDYFTAFRPTERGGEQFTRTLLVQAAAISPPTLGDFRSLRDMAWDDVNYVCVRDEEGNRWFANVIVPGGRVMRNRRIYMAPVQIREVTTTPTPVDPVACDDDPGFDVCDDAFECSDVVASDSFTRTETDTWGVTT